MSTSFRISGWSPRLFSMLVWLLGPFLLAHVVPFVLSVAIRVLSRSGTARVPAPLPWALFPAALLSSVVWWFALTSVVSEVSPKLLEHRHMRILPPRLQWVWPLALWAMNPPRAAATAGVIFVVTVSGGVFLSTAASSAIARGPSLLELVPFGVASTVCAFLVELDMPQYPCSHQWRGARLSSALPSIVRATVTPWLAATIMVTALSCVHVSTALSSESAALPLPTYWRLVTSGLLLSAALAYAFHLASIVASEPLTMRRRADESPEQLLPALMQTMSTAPRGVDQASHLQALADASRYHGRNFWLPIFQDPDSVPLWASLATACLAELDAFSDSALCVVDAFEATQSTGTLAINPTGTAATRALGGALPRLPAERRLDRHVAACGARALWSGGLLADAAVLSRLEDTYGLLQLPPEGTPGLADGVAAILRAGALARFCLLNHSRRGAYDQWVRERAMQQTGRKQSANAPWHTVLLRALDPCRAQCPVMRLHHVHDGLQFALDRIVSEFGPDAVHKMAYFQREKVRVLPACVELATYVKSLDL